MLQRISKLQPEMSYAHMYPSILSLFCQNLVLSVLCKRPGFLCPAHSFACKC